MIANPPYIIERDEARKKYHRELVGRARRYVTATGKYSLGAVFVERCFQLSTDRGFVGLITSNNFMKREFGKALIEKVLAHLDLQLVVDASHARIPFHSTPTALIFGRRRDPQQESVRVVMGKRGEAGSVPFPAAGEVWTSIRSGFDKVGFENEYISVANVPRTTLRKHPWSLGGGGAGELKAQLDESAERKLSSVCTDIGPSSFPGIDDVFIMPEAVQGRLRVPESYTKPFCAGDSLRDWAYHPGDWAVAPYDAEFVPVEEHELGAAQAHFWRYRTTVRANIGFGGKTRGQSGEPHWTWYRWIPDRFRTPLSIAFSFVATHNHFVVDRGGKVFNRSAPVIKLGDGAHEEDYLSLAALLNSSAECFWMKQVFYPKASATHDVDKAGTLPENNRYEFDATKMRQVPLPRGLRESRLAVIARRMESLALERAAALPRSVLYSRTHDFRTTGDLRQLLSDAQIREQDTHRRMVFWQEEIDWEVYCLFGLVEKSLAAITHEEPIDPDARPFAWSSDAAPVEVPESLRALYSDRRALAVAGELKLLESPVNKRPWRGVQGVFGRYDRTYEEKTRTALSEWLTDRVEQELQGRAGKPAAIAQLTTALEADPRVHAVAELLTGRKDYRLADLIAEAVTADAVPAHPLHVFTATGLEKRAAWERTWEEQRKEDAGQPAKPEVPPKYGNGDFLRPEYFRLRGKLDVPKERFIAFTEVPGRGAGETLYGWAGWTPAERVKAILAMDEACEDQGIALADRIALLDSAWRLIPDVLRDDPSTGARLKAELQAVVGPEGPSKVMLEDWQRRFPPPGRGRGRAARAAAAPTDDREDEDDA